MRVKFFIQLTSCMIVSLQYEDRNKRAMNKSESTKLDPW